MEGCSWQETRLLLSGQVERRLLEVHFYLLTDTCMQATPQLHGHDHRINDQVLAMLWKHEACHFMSEVLM